MMLDRNTVMIGGQFYGRTPLGWQKFDSQENYELWKWIDSTEETNGKYLMEALKWA